MWEKKWTINQAWTECQKISKAWTCSRASRRHFIIWISKNLLNCPKNRMKLCIDGPIKVRYPIDLWKNHFRGKNTKQRHDKKRTDNFVEYIMSSQLCSSTMEPVRLLSTPFFISSALSNTHYYEIWDIQPVGHTGGRRPGDVSATLLTWVCSFLFHF